ncbi:MAG: hypothetical protein OEW68_06825 [Gammaproteobacteria bacterium]|nr:hypothetical protein [Gammaproteobacteria bacterium]MDH4314537.1 hypothetical protein [Gammaproteobacteria bacterium]MDH5213982.1 hypothetical protein [Gammaproteobacteria bacterium]
MGPLTVITGILLGSCLSISFSLAAVLLMVLVVGTDDPRLGHELPGLLSSLLVFLGMTVMSALSFYLLIKGHPARWLAQAIMWAGFAVTGLYFWP